MVAATERSRATVPGRKKIFLLAVPRPVAVVVEMDLAVGATLAFL